MSLMIRKYGDDDDSIIARASRVIESHRYNNRFGCTGCDYTTYENPVTHSDHVAEMLAAEGIIG